MKIGLYGLPGAGKSHFLEALGESTLCSLEILTGSALLLERDPLFSQYSPQRKQEARKALALELQRRDHFCMCGHYAFGEELAFTCEDGDLYDVFCYLYVEPSVLKERMKASSKNQKYLDFDLDSWQNKEIEGLRRHCHQHKKDFYVLDAPKEGGCPDIAPMLGFFQSLEQGYSCVGFAKEKSEEILRTIMSSKN